MLHTSFLKNLNAADDLDVPRSRGVWVCEICHRTPLIQRHISPSDTTQRCSRCCCKLCVPNSKTQANPKTGRLPLPGVANASNKVTMLRWLWARRYMNNSVANRLQSSGCLATKCFATKIDGLSVGNLSFFSTRYTLLKVPLPNFFTLWYCCLNTSVCVCSASILLSSPASSALPDKRRSKRLMGC